MVTKNKEYYKNLASKNSRSARKQIDLRKKYEEGIEKGIALAKEANR